MYQSHAKTLASIICAFAAGSRIQMQSPYNKQWFNVPPGDSIDFEKCIENNISLRIAPKPPKVKLARIALCNLAKVTDENFATFPATGVQPKAMEEDWLAAELIVRGGDCDLFEQHPTFVKWISEPFQLISGKHAA